MCKTCKTCFIEGTIVRLKGSENGLPIEYYEDVIVSESDHFYSITIKNEMIQVTGNHLVRRWNGDYCKVQDLKQGDNLQTEIGIVPVSSIDRFPVFGSCPVYSLDDSGHDILIGENRIKFADSTTMDIYYKS